MTRIFITGANGFIGSEFCTSLDKNSLPYYKFTGDLTDFNNTLEQIQTQDFDHLFHCAGMSDVGSCEKNPDKAFQVNVTGTFNLLASLRRTNKKTKFIFLSTSHVYDYSKLNNENQMIDEVFPVGPQKIYPLTKLHAEELIKHHFNYFDLGQSIILRLFNHTGKNQKGPFFFPQIIEQIKSATKDQPIVKTGNLKVVRDFSLIDDLIKSFIQILKTNFVTKNEVINVCSGQGRSLETLANFLKDELKKEFVIFEDQAQGRSSYEPSIIIGNNLKIKKLLNHNQQELADIDFIKKVLR